MVCLHVTASLTLYWGPGQGPAFPAAREVSGMTLFQLAGPAFTEVAQHRFCVCVKSLTSY